MTGTAICWHTGPWRSHDCRRFPDMVWFYGRCRSGQRWFWAATAAGDELAAAHCWEASEDAALAAARQAIIEVTGGRTAVARLRHGTTNMREGPRRCRSRPLHRALARRVRHCGRSATCLSGVAGLL